MREKTFLSPEGFGEVLGSRWHETGAHKLPTSIRLAKLGPQQVGSNKNFQGAY